LSSSPERKYFRAGVLGGMGPEAGVLLQQLIIRETPAATDQDHIEVVAYTNPHVPDRTESLKNDGGASYLAAVIDSLKLLEGVGVDVLVIACNTAHARFAEIQASVTTPMIHIVELAKAEILAKDDMVGILATDGTIASGLFAVPERSSAIITPPTKVQTRVMQIIRDIKAGLPSGDIVNRLEAIVLSMQAPGCARIVLGCTELSIYRERLVERFGDVFIDPMLLAARRIVDMAGARIPDSGFRI